MTRLHAPLAVLLAASLAVPTASARSAPEGQKALPAFASVEVSDSFGAEAGSVGMWTRDAVIAGVERSGIDAAKVREGRHLDVRITGGRFAYVITMQVVGAHDAEPKTLECKCNARSFGDLLTEQVAKLAPALVEPVPGPVAATPAPLQPSEGPVTPPHDEGRPASKAQIGAGWALVGAGAGAAIAGIVMLALPKNREALEGDSDRWRERNLVPAGASLLAVGAAVAVIGGVLVGTARRKAARRTTLVAPTLDRRSVGFSLIGRF